MKGGTLRKLILLTIPLLISFQFAPNSQKIENEIQTVIEKQKILWNEGNIEGFMGYYWKSEKFTFQSGNQRLHGWDALLSRYKTSYSGENMGVLDFTDIEIRVLSSDFAYVLGRWKLKLKDTVREGLFTIIFQRMRKGWRIVHDHTSS